MTTPSQQLIARRYQLIRQLAAGSYAETWLANDVSLDRYVAIKLLSPADNNEYQETMQFLREARIAAAVSHPNIVAVFDAGSTNQRPYLVMEWVDGASLKQEIMSVRRVSLNRAIAVTAELLDGLSSIHEQGIIHRDVKPQNIMVNELGHVKLTDFGIARLLSEIDGRGDGTTAGSAAYMAPEQAQGHPVTSAADTYAAGVILYEMLTGRLPFVDEDPHNVIQQHISDPVARPRRFNPAIPHQIEAIIVKALEKDPSGRFQSADEMRDALLSADLHAPARRPVYVSEYQESSRGVIPRFAWITASVAFMLVMVAGATTFAVRDLGATETVAENNEPTPTATVTASETEVPVEEEGVIVDEEETVPIDESPSTPPPEEPQEDEPYFAEEYADNFVRGEVVVEGVPEYEPGVNRPAPFGDGTGGGENDAPQSEPVEVAAPPVQEEPQPAPEPTAPPEPEPSSDEESDEQDTREDDNEAEDIDEVTEDDEHAEPEDSGNSEESAEGEQESDGRGDENSDESEYVPEKESDDIVDEAAPESDQRSEDEDEAEEDDHRLNESESDEEDDHNAQSQSRAGDDEDDEDEPENSDWTDDDHRSTESESDDDEEGEAQSQGRSGNDEDDESGSPHWTDVTEQNNRSSSSESDEDDEDSRQDQNRSGSDDEDDEEESGSPHWTDVIEQNNRSSSDSDNDDEDDRQPQNRSGSDDEDDESDNSERSVEDQLRSILDRLDRDSLRDDDTRELQRDRILQALEEDKDEEQERRSDRDRDRDEKDEQDTTDDNDDTDQDDDENEEEEEDRRQLQMARSDDSQEM